MVAGGHAWLPGGWGACVVAGGHAWLPGGMHGCQGACMVGGICGCWGACMVAGGMRGYQGVCVVAGECVWLPGGVCIGYDVIWSISGRYASYRNAFLFSLCS